MDVKLFYTEGGNDASDRLEVRVSEACVSRSDFLVRA